MMGSLKPAKLPVGDEPAQACNAGGRAFVRLPSDTNLVARFGIMGGLGGMGAKYLPTHKDLKASQRFQQKQNPLHKFKKSPAAAVKKTGGKK
jgi:hypothetical protein